MSSSLCPVQIWKLLISLDSSVESIPASKEVLPPFEPPISSAHSRMAKTYNLFSLIKLFRNFLQGRFTLFLPISPMITKDREGVHTAFELLDIAFEFTL